MNKDALKAAQEHNPRHPGKFQGEPPETVYYYYLMMDGESDYAGIGWDAFRVTPEEAQTFDIKGPFFAIEETDQGFVYGGDGFSEERILRWLEEEAEAEVE